MLSCCGEGTTTTTTTTTTTKKQQSRILFLGLKKGREALFLAKFGHGLGGTYMIDARHGYVCQLSWRQVLPEGVLCFTCIRPAACEDETMVPHLGHACL